MHMVMTVLTMPQFANTYRFLINVDKHQMQRIYEVKSFQDALYQTNEILGDFISKMSIWAELEKQHEFRQD